MAQESNEPLERKRVLIQPAGRAWFALPDQHSAEIVTIGSQDDVPCRELFER